MSLSDPRALIRNGSLILWLTGALLMLPAHGQNLPPAQSAKDALSNPAVAGDSGTDSGAGASDSSTANGALPPAGMVINGGRLPVQLGLTVGGYYDDNIYIQPKGAPKTSDFIWSLSPLIAWNSAAQTGTDNSIQISYSPTVLFYQTHVNNDTVDQDGNFIYAYHDGKTDLVISQLAESVQESDADYGNLVTENTYDTTLNFNYQLTGRLSTNFIATQVITGDDPGLGSTQWTAADYFDYQAAPKTSVGLGALIGFADLEGPNQVFQQINARVSYRPTAKLSFNATVGLEFRQTQGSGNTLVTPDFSLGAKYEPFDGTDLALEAYRRYDYSGRFYGDDYLATGASASLSQRFLQKFYFVLTGAFEDAQYIDNFSNSYIDQSYDYFSVRPAVTFRPTAWCELIAFYQYRNNIARGDVDSFVDNQVGFSAKFTY